MKSKSGKPIRSAKKVVDGTTEARIKEAAPKVFTRKGFAGARTRDIAEEAGINLALLNYYFRSKQKLFDLIMMENIQHFMEGVKAILSDDNTTLTEKNTLLGTHYIDILARHPDLPLFILSELRSHPDKLVARMGIKEFIFQSSYFQQLIEAVREKGANVNPLHYFMNTMALIVFPFIGSPMLRNIGQLDREQFTALMNERKPFIAKWVNAMMDAEK